jgi:hypothetical protein
LEIFEFDRFLVAVADDGRGSETALPAKAAGLFTKR